MGESLKRFGIASDCSHVLVASIHTDAPDVSQFFAAMHVLSPLCLAAYAKWLLSQCCNDCSCSCHRKSMLGRSSVGRCSRSAR